MECPTVRIKATTGSYPFTTINEVDFDVTKHELYVENDAPIIDAPTDAPLATPDEPADAPMVDAPIAKHKKGGAK